MQLPGGPRTPSFIQIFQWATRPSDYLDASTQHYGDIFTANWPGYGPAVLVSNPSALEQIFTAPQGTFDSGRGNEVLRPVMGQYSLMLLDGRPHQRMRRLLMPPFHGERMRLYGNLICDLAEQMVQQWQVGEPFNVRLCMKEITLRVILRAIFGMNEEERLEQLRQRFRMMQEMTNSPLGSIHLLMRPLQKDFGSRSVWGRFLRLRREVNQLIYAEIAQRRSQHPQPDRTDILTLLMAARDEQGQSMTDEELHDELISLFAAGNDTTATALTWALYWIDSVPSVREQLLKELDSLDDLSDTTAISRLPYLTATCQEALRFYPPIVVAFPRVVNTSFEMMGYQLPARTQIFPNIYSTHHRADVYPEPEQFKPERFLERQFSPYEYLPFGGGSRLCIGQALGQFEMKLVLATILSRCQLERSDRHPVRPIRRGGGLAPAKPLQMRVTAIRRPQFQPSLQEVVS